MAATDYNAVVQQLYVSYFGRPADTYGLQNFAARLAALDSGATLTTLSALSLYVQQNPTSAIATLAASFSAQPESIALYGSGTTILDISKFVNAIYNNVLHRDADTGGGTFWINEIASGRLSKANAALAITQGALENNSTAGLVDAAIVKATAAAATDFTSSLDSIPKINAYAGDAAAAQARDLLKTVTATTTVTAFHASVSAAIAVLTAPPTVNAALTAGVDSLTGTGANDVYNALVSATAGATTFNAFDAINGGGGTNTLKLVDTVGALDLSVATISNIQNALIQSTGGLLANKADLSGWTGLSSATLLLKAYAVQNITVADTTALTVVSTRGAMISGGATVAVTAGFSSDGYTLYNATAGAQNFAFRVTTTASGFAARFASSPGVAAADVAIINAAVGADGASGSPAGIAVIAAINAAVTRQFAAAGALYHAGDVTIAGNALTSASVTGGATIVVGDNGNGTLTTVTLNGAGGTATLTGSALTNLVMNGTDSDVTIVNATAGHVDTITLNGSTSNSTLSDAKAKAVVLDSSGAASVLGYLFASTATSLTVGGATALTLQNQSMALVTAVTVVGAGGFTGDFSHGVGAAAVITATASTGANNVAIGAGQSYLGGAGIDTVTISAAPTAAVSGGAGSADVLVLKMATAFNASANSKIAGFETMGLGSGTGAVSYDATGFAHLQIAGPAGAATFSNVAAGVDLAFSAAAGHTITYSLLNSAGTADVLNLAVRGATTAAATNALVALGVETINIVTTDTSTVANHAAFAGSLVLTDSALTAIKISGNMGLTLDTYTTPITSITSLDASGITAGGLNWTTGILDAVAAPVTIKGSASGGDYIDAHYAVGKGATITVNGGTNSITGSRFVGSTLNGASGADAITGGIGADIIIGGGGADVIDGASGADLITVSGNTSTVMQYMGSSGVNNATGNLVAELTSSFDVVLGLAAGDKINLNNSGIVTGTMNLAAASLAGGANDSAVFAAGTYNAVAGTFTYAANGLDTALTYDSDSSVGSSPNFTPNSQFETIILVGYHATAAATTVVAGVITL